MHRLITIFLPHSSYEDQTGRNYVQYCHLQFGFQSNFIVHYFLKPSRNSQILENRLNPNGSHWMITYKVFIFLCVLEIQIDQDHMAFFNYE